MREIPEQNQILGENIKREREKAGYTQERFSEIIDMTPNNLSAVERGVAGVSLKTLRRICEALKVSADDLLFGQREKSDGEALIRKLERLDARQMRIVQEVLLALLEAFALKKEDGETDHGGDDTDY
ncbi:MAG: helix-turn-helix domain-containing protein [Clostridiales bacterium]|nr:helix-turn-helix domain-containing protein [Clostridiales bacterium]